LDKEYQDPEDDRSEEENLLSHSRIHQQEEDQGPSLDQQLADLFAQAFQQPLPPPPPEPDPAMADQQPPTQPAAVTIESNDKGLIGDPINYNGKLTEYKNFKQSLLTHFRFYEGKFTNNQKGDVKKQLIVISKMKSGSAQQWAHRHFDKFGHRPDHDWPSWDKFMTQMDTTFMDHNAESKARDKIVHYNQGTLTINAFFNNFKLLADEAGIGVGNESLLNYYLEKNVKQTIIDRIVRDKDISTYTYKQFKIEILHIGRLHEAHDRRTHEWNREHYQPNSSQTNTHTDICTRSQNINWYYIWRTRTTDASRCSKIKPLLQLWRSRTLEKKLSQTAEETQRTHAHY
jgi:hypothetical protein